MTAEPTVATVAHDQAMRALAATLTERTLAGDGEGVAALYAPEAVIWRTFDQRELLVGKVAKIIRYLATALRDRRYEDVRVTPTPTGFVQQHVLVGTTASGERVHAPACMVVQVDGGRIVRLDEYLDSAHLAPLLRG